MEILLKRPHLGVHYTETRIEALMNKFSELDTALAVLRDYFQAAHRETEELRFAASTHDNRLTDIAASAAEAQQALHVVRQRTDDLDAEMKKQLAIVLERLEALAVQQDAQAQDTTQLASHLETHSQETVGLRDGYHHLQAETQSIQATVQTSFDRLEVRLEGAHQQLQAITQNDILLRDEFGVHRDTLQHIDTQLTTYQDRLGELTTDLRQTCAETAALQQELTALETTVAAQILEAHNRRFEEMDQSLRNQHHDMLELRQALADLQRTLRQRATLEPVWTKPRAAILGFVFMVIVATFLVLVTTLTTTSS